MRPAHELLYDSEASLRLVDRAIGDLSPASAEAEHDAPVALRQHLEQEPGPGDYTYTALDDYANTAAIVVRFCQSAGMLDAGGSDALRHMPGRIREVAARTEAATGKILDGLGRALVLVDALDGRDALTDDARHRIAASLRDELSTATNHMQFQDITSQQLADIAALFADMRSRIAQVVSIFATPITPTTCGLVDADGDKDESQALADEIFSVHGTLTRA